MFRSASASEPHRLPIADPCGGIMTRLRRAIVPTLIGSNRRGNSEVCIRVLSTAAHHNPVHDITRVTSLHRRAGGPHVRTRPGHDEMEWITDFREADEILKSKQFRNTLHDGPARWIIGDTIGTLHGEAHTYRRRTEMLMFSRPALMSYELGLIRPALREALAAGAGRARVPIQGVMRAALLRVSARIVGLDVESTEDT